MAAKGWFCRLRIEKSMSRRPEEWSRLSNLAPEMRSAIESRIDHELARRAVAGSMVYFVVCVVVSVSTPYYADHPVALVLAGCLTLLVGGMRLLAARRVLRRAAGAVSRDAIVFKGATYATFVVWGIFCAWTVHWYAGEWTAMLLLLCTAALAGGASSTLAPDLILPSPV